MNLKNVLLNLSFKNLIYCDDKEVGQILKMRNENYIRKNMFTKKIISLEQHHLWFQSLKNKNNHKFYCIYYKDKIIGGLSLKNINEDLKSADWGFYIINNTKVVGMGGAVEFKAIEYIFNIYKINYLSCYVMKHNNDVIKLHKKLGFDEIEINEKDLKFMSKKDKKSVSKFLLTVKKWQIQKEIILRKYFEN